MKTPNENARAYGDASRAMRESADAIRRAIVALGSAPVSSDVTRSQVMRLRREWDAAVERAERFERLSK